MELDENACEFPEQGIVDEDICLHSNQIDNGEGMMVCESCGFVQDSSYTMPSSNAKNVCNDSLKFNNIGDKLSRQEIMISFLCDICANNNIVGCILQRAISIYKASVKTSTKQGIKISNHHLATMALYESFVLEHAPRTPQEVCVMCDFPISQFWRIEKKQLHNFSIDPSLILEQTELCERFCSLLNLSFKDTQSIIQLLRSQRSTRLQSMRPQSVAAAIIYYYCREYYPNVSLNSICNVCSVSKGNVRNIIRLYYNK